MEKIKLTQGKVALVDDADYEYLNQFQWHVYKATGNGYLWYASRGKKLGYSTKMHRLIMGLIKGDGKEIDHVNGKTLDNRRSNLRICTRQQNLANMTSRTGVSKYKGVSWAKNEKKWLVHFRGKYVGYFKDEIEAAKAYDQVAFEYFKHFAKLNFPNDLCS